MQLTQKLSIIGCGNIAQSLLAGLIQGDFVSKENIQATTAHSASAQAIASKFSIKTSTDNASVIAWADIVVLAVKPQTLPQLLQKHADSFKPHQLVISLAAGLSSQTLEKQLPPKTKLVRAMPNVLAAVNAAVTGLSRGTHATDTDLAFCEKMFHAIGIVEIIDESLFDAVAALSGSGPAYMFLILDALADGGVRVGLSRKTAERLAAHTLLGSAKLFIESNDHPGALKDKVTSPGGSTIAALHTLEEGGIRATLINAVISATERNKALGKTNES